MLQHCEGIAASYFKTRLSLRSLLPPLEQLVGVDLAVVGVIVLMDEEGVVANFPVFTQRLEVTQRSLTGHPEVTQLGVQKG